jgi:release factor glutamine methyltransferase
VSGPRLNAEHLLAHCTGRSRVDLYAYPEREISTSQRRAFALGVRRRASREPLQYILGSKGFRYLELAVDRRVLIPRPETEMLVERALGLIRMAGGHPVVVDVGTGSGCIALSICRECPGAVVHATDICGLALEAARANSIRLGLAGLPSFHLGDLLDALPPELQGRCDLIVSNPPYVREGDFTSLPPEVREHEPYHSLVAGPLGVEKHLLLMRQAPWWLAPGGWLLMEGAEDQMEELAPRAEEMGYREIGVQEDLNRRPRIIEMRAGA